MISERTRRNLRRELRRSLLAKLGIVVVILMVAMAVFAPFISPYSPSQQSLDNSRQPPLGFSTKETKEVTKMEDGSVVIEDGQVVTETQTVYTNATAAHPLGTDGNGRDILSRIIYGARTSILVGLFGTSLAALIGVLVGLSAGFYRGRVDDLLMRSADIMLAFPSLVLAIALVGVWGQAQAPIPDPFVATGLAPAFRSAVGLPTGMPETVVLPGTVIVVVALVNWVWFARVARGEALSIREEEYVKAAKALGASDGRTMLRHVLPNAITPILVLATIQVAAIILLESALSFLGFSGADVSWGFDIALGRQYQSTAWWISTMPGLAIVVTVIGLNLVGDWLRDALDPGIEGEGGV
ncbi:binding-protein-dependent transporters inner membrane component [Haloferax gibbonsii ATCC 33959]|uniref:Binding-protein-dependent transporters inner membrane component n=1 Tax=Haloferax gibbonsii (strain ATCC 33959 / DSM 4427 / JCM 8863 / NBRC 102184 / NCIMB 2188 / Ma 2.38) TaxID=1227459 RepID=M0HA69_HALGM|nr:ABC transporter permease [Haloferax gibbonsii]ELZ80683.1 binding-protein-dependent transporters inner membrane component [Haloferax gibbonsii ATCC 33959]